MKIATVAQVFGTRKRSLEYKIKKNNAKAIRKLVQSKCAKI